MLNTQPSRVKGLLVGLAFTCLSCGPCWESVYIEDRLYDLSFQLTRRNSIHAAINFKDSTYVDYRWPAYADRRIDALFSNGEDFARVDTIKIDSLVFHGYSEFNEEFAEEGRSTETTIALYGYLGTDYTRTFQTRGRTFLANHDSSNVLDLSDGLTVDIRGGSDSTVYQLEWDSIQIPFLVPRQRPSKTIPIVRTKVTGSLLRLESSELTSVLPQNKYYLIARDRELILDTLQNGKVLAIAFERICVMQLDTR